MTVASVEEMMILGRMSVGLFSLISNYFPILANCLPLCNVADWTATAEAKIYLLTGSVSFYCLINAIAISL